MKIALGRSPANGRVRAPSSKSYTIRGLVCAALAKGESRINYPLLSDDTEAAARVLTQIGVTIKQEIDQWQVSGGDFHTPQGDLFCGDSAATLRFMTAVSTLVPGECRLTAGSSLAKRPVAPLVQALNGLGVNCTAQSGLPPVTVRSSQLKGGITSIPGDVSSQFVSALLLIAPLAERVVTVRLTTPLESKPYIMMTLDCLQEFGIRIEASADLVEFRAVPQVYRRASYSVEGDWSSASYLLALGALSGPVTVESLNPDSRQGDRVLLDFLRRMGTKVTLDKNAVTVRKSELNAIAADLTDCIDLLPTVAVLAAAARGMSQLSGIERARLKESDRVAAVKEGLERMGIQVTEERNRLIITGGNPHGAEVSGWNDHRIAMAFGVLGTIAGDTIIDGADCVAKTFPDFWKVLGRLGVEVKQIG